MGRPSFAQLAAALGLCALLLSCEGVVNEQIPVPDAEVECITTECTQSIGAKALYVYLSKSTCADPFFGSYITGTGEVTCSGTSCTGHVSQWSQDSRTISSMQSGGYSVCAVIDLVDTNVPGLPSYTASGNATLSMNEFIDRDTQVLELINWQDN